MMQALDNITVWKIPANWLFTVLSDLGHGENAIVDGPFGSNLKVSDYIPDSVNGIPVLTTKNLEGDYSEGTVRYVSQEKFNQLKRSSVKPGDILVAKIGSVGKTGIYPQGHKTALIPANLLKFTPTDKISFKFLYYYLNYIEFQKFIRKISTATAQPAFNLTKFRRLPIPLPPLNEQKRIVAKVDELLSRLDNAVKCLLASEARQKAFYQSVLDHAFTSCTERRNLENLISQKLSNGYSGKPVAHQTRYKVLSLSSTTSGVFLDTYFKFLDEKNLEDRDIWCAPNDILIQRGNTIEYVGVSVIYTGKPDTFIFPDLMIRIRADENTVSTKFLHYALSSPKIRNYLRKHAKGSAGTMPKINQSILSSIPIPFCSKQKQQEIVDKIEEQLSNCSAINIVIQQSLAKAHILRQSILKKAFSGQLVAQDAHDEPASILLERIRTEKTTAKPVIKKLKEKRSAA